jgi:PhnB protein
MAKKIPDGFHSVTAALTVREGAKMIDFYKQAFGAQEVMRMAGPDGKSLMHAEIKIGDSVVMLSDEQPGGCRAPIGVGACTSYLYVYVPDVDKTFNQATKAGAKVVMPLADMFWGDRYGVVIDPFGQVWGIATHVKDLSPEEAMKAGQEWAAKNMPPGGQRSTQTQASF